MHHTGKKRDGKQEILTEKGKKIGYKKFASRGFGPSESVRTKSLSSLYPLDHLGKS